MQQGGARARRLSAGAAGHAGCHPPLVQAASCTVQSRGHRACVCVGTRVQHVAPACGTWRHGRWRMQGRSMAAAAGACVRAAHARPLPVAGAHRCTHALHVLVHMRACAAVRALAPSAARACASARGTGDDQPSARAGMLGWAASGCSGTRAGTARCLGTTSWLMLRR